MLFQAIHSTNSNSCSTTSQYIPTAPKLLWGCFFTFSLHITFFTTRRKFEQGFDFAKLGSGPSVDIIFVGRRKKNVNTKKLGLSDQCFHCLSTRVLNTCELERRTKKYIPGERLSISRVKSASRYLPRCRNFPWISKR